MAKVYVAEQGLYEQCDIVGIFDSPERAMAIFPGQWRKTTWTWFEGPSDDRRSVISHTVSWENDLDVRIYEMEIIDTGPLRAVDEAVVQTYRVADGGWDYIPEDTVSATATP